jgi:hypothetical protein
MRRDSCRPERYSSSKRAFSSLRLCWATQSAKQLFSRALKVVSLESLLAFLTRPSLSTTVVLICSPVITMSYKNHTNIPGCPEEAALDNRVVSACTESAGCSTSQSMARGLLKQLPELDSSNGDQLARPLECPIALVRKLHHRRCDGTDVGGRRRGATLSRHSTGREPLPARASFLTFWTNMARLFPSWNDGTRNRRSSITSRVSPSKAARTTCRPQLESAESEEESDGRSALFME